MSAPLVALVGRPNVGKSTLFNRLVRRRQSLVFDRPGVTRDRIFGDVVWNERVFQVVDTGGFESKSDDPLMSRMREQTEIAVTEADVIVLVVDARAGIQPGDREVVEMIRRSGKEFAIAANKIDTVKQEDLVYEFYQFGAEYVFPLSAEHDLGMEEFLNWAVDTSGAQPKADDLNLGPKPVLEEEPEEGTASRIEWDDQEPIRVAVIGKPNVGKSTLINKIIGEERLLASDVSGTTRDSIDVQASISNREFVFVDTAGMRRKKVIADKVEHFSVMLAHRSLESCDVALFVLNGTERISDQDSRIVSMAHRMGKGVVVVASQWDRIENTEWKERYEEAMRVDLPFVDYTRFIRVSGKTGRGIDLLAEAIVDAQRERHRRIATSELNRFFQAVVEMRPPSAKGGRRPKLFYVTQPHVRPPTFIFMAKNAELVDATYGRFLRNQLRKYFGFEGSPVWLKFRDMDKSKKGKILDQ